MTAAMLRSSSTKATSSKTAANGSIRRPANKEEQVIKDLLKKVHAETPNRWHGVVKDWKGVSEETTTGVPPPL